MTNSQDRAAPSEPVASTTEDLDVSARLQTRSGMLKVVGTSAAARMIVLPVSAILGIILTRLIIQSYGKDTYAQYILLVGLVALLPFADLGMGAAIMNAVASAKDPRRDSHLHGVLVSSLRVFMVCGPVVMITAVILYLGDWWPTLLGSGLTLKSGSLAASLCLGILGFNILVSFGQRMLVALGRNSLVILLQGIQTPIVLLFVLFLRNEHTGDGGYIAVVSYATTSLGALICLAIAARKTRPMLRRAAADATNRSVKGAPVFNTAWPMFVQMIALPIAMSSDKVVLSHLGTVQDLTEYSLAAQMFLPVYGVVAAAGQSLWPVFARARTSGDQAPLSADGMARIFAGFSLLAVVLLCAVANPLADLASDGKIHLSWYLLIAFSVFIVTQAAMYPYGMVLTDASGLTFQALWMVFGLLPVNLGLTILLTPALGPIGPVIGSIVGVLTCQLIPNVIRVRRTTAASAKSQPVVPAN